MLLFEIKGVIAKYKTEKGRKMYVGSEKQMRIERAYYDEKEKMLEEIRQEISALQKERSPEEKQAGYDRASEKIREIISEAGEEAKKENQKWNPEEDAGFMSLVRKVLRFAESSACNLRIETDSDRLVMIKIQTDEIWILCDGETSLEEKTIVQELFQKADYIHIGNNERNGRSMVELEFHIKMG